MISIIMPFYNREKVLERAINSVLIQTYTDWELILVNDGSTDSSEALVSRFHDSRIHYIKSDKNRGACHARNIGLKNASGEVIGFLDSDNVWDKHFLEVRMKEMQSKNLDFVFGLYCYVDRTGGEKIWPEVSSSDINDRQSVIKHMCKDNLIDTNTVLLSRRCVDRIGVFDESLKRFQDWDYFGRLFWEKDLKYFYQDNLLVKGYEQNNSISNIVSYWDARIELLYRNLDKIRSLDMLLAVMRHLYELTFFFPISAEQKKKIFGVMTADDYFQFLEQQKQTDKNISCLYSLYKAKHWIIREEEFEQDTSILVYGYGDVGKDFVYQIQCSRKLCLVGVIDRKYVNSKNDSIHFFEISDMKNLQYDYMLVAVFDKKAAENIIEELIDAGAVKEKIVWVDLMKECKL